jgi:hypothetical protein
LLTDTMEMRRIRSMGEVINAAFSLFRERFTEIIRLFFICLFPVSLLLILVSSLLAQSLYVPVDTTAGDPQFENIGFLFVVYLFFFIYLFYALSFIIHYFRAIVEKEAIAPAMLVNRSVRTMLPLLGQTVLVSVIVMVGMLLFIIPGIYFAIALSLAPIALVLGDNSVIGSMNNSMKAVRGSWWTTLAFGLVLGLLIGLIFIILLIPSFVLIALGVESDPGAGLNAGMMVLGLVSGIWFVVVMHLIYFVQYFAYGFYYLSQMEKKEAGAIAKEVNEI